MPATEPAPDEICLRAIESFHVGGEVRTLRGLPTEARRLAQGAEPRPVDPNGDHVVGQMYVQAYRLARPRHALPVLFWHGGGMTGVNWETTPDGRPGWLWRFLGAGYDVYVSDAVERGRASWARFPELYAGAPLFRTMDEAWDMFRMGPAHGYRTDPAARLAHAAQQFPVGAFDQFARQWVPRWAGHEAVTSAAYRALLDRVGPCIVVGHSQGGGFALLAAQERPESVRAVVALEPSGAPAAPPAAIPPHLIVWGDHIGDHPVWRRYRATVDAYAAVLARSGAAVESLDLPAEGVRGNSHFLMMDRNSGLIADRVLRWLDALDPRHP
ncbi:alpha/beta fold hydrolase [Pigmentiphaga sp. GD03639]|uniref:alpha/beta fold hydrolase n=1 Tax=unclassified Pigmentiphaga TaxID=2626614 RepID=UPI00105237D5|nr:MULTISPECIES: alpha/beta fold hydrolase [unclassified Pigmentiphaga]MDH2238587.1 alpha/beta fold hydrolase [Pigmentiphaga sp. GD03639]